MALSFSEKRALQKTIFDQRALLAGGNLSFSEKRNAQKAIFEARAKLTSDAVVAVVESLFQQIAKGIHDALGAVEVFKKIKAEIDRIGEDVIAFDNTLNDQLKAACVKNAELAETEGLLA